MHELQDALCRKAVAYDLQSEELKKLEQEHKIASNELKKYISLTSRLETQVDELKSAERDIKNLLDDNIIKMEDALICREKLEKEKASLQKEEESTCKKMKQKVSDLFDDHEKIVVKMNKCHSREINVKEEEINSLLMQVNKLNYQVEQKTRESESMEKKHKNLVDANNTRRNDFEQNLESMSVRIIDMETELNNEIKKRRVCELSYKKMEEQIKDLKKCNEIYEIDLSTEQSRNEQTLLDFEQKYQSIKSENAKLAQEVSTLLGRIEEEKNSAKNKLDIQLQQKMIELEEYRNEIKDLNRKLADCEVQINEKIQTIQVEKEDDVNEKCKRISIIEINLKEEKELCLVSVDS